MSRQFALVLIAINVTACRSTDLPDGYFEGAEPIELSQAQCDDAVDPDSSPAVSAQRTAREVDGTAAPVFFRCSQEVCGYLQTERDVAQVLFQPCDMDPETVPRCSCAYALDFSFTANTDLGALDAYRREDRYGGNDDEPEFLASTTIWAQ